MGFDDAKNFFHQAIFFLKPVFNVADTDEEQGVDGASTGTTQLFAASVDFEDRFLQAFKVDKNLTITRSIFRSKNAALFENVDNTGSSSIAEAQASL